jgi:hypothetical protein
VWCRFRWEIEAIQKILMDNYSFKVITGDTPLELRKLYQNRLEHKEIDILVLQIATSKYGLNLSSASTSIYFSNSLVVDDREQSEMRIEHNDKKEPLLYIDLVTKDSIDEDILKAFDKKKKNSYYFMNKIVENLKKRHV